MLLTYSPSTADNKKRKTDRKDYLISGGEEMDILLTYLLYLQNATKLSDYSTKSFLICTGHPNLALCSVDMDPFFIIHYR